MKKFLKKISPFIPESKLKDDLRCLQNNFLTDNRFKVSRKKNLLQFKFKDNSKFICSFASGSGTIIEEARIILEGYLKYYKLRKGDIIIDCGAHIGMFSLFASQKVGHHGKIIALEPDDENYKELLGNIKLNNVKNIIAVNKGVWDKNAELNFEGSLGVSSTISQRESGEKVLVSTIDNIVKEFKLKRVDFIKMDIEGAEIEAIIGAKKTLKNNNVNLAIASYHLRDGQQTYKRLEKILKNMNYNTITTFSDHLTTFAKPK